MRVDRYISENQKVTFRIMDTTCPKCKQHVQFALNDDEYVENEIKFKDEIIAKLRAEISRLCKTIDKILQNKPLFNNEKTNDYITKIKE